MTAPAAHSTQRSCREGKYPGGSGDPFVRAGQLSASVLIEAGNEEGEFFFFDLGSGALANFNGHNVWGHRRADVT